MIYIDDRIGSKDLLNYMPAHTAELTRLQFGDAMWLGNGPEGCPVHVGLELKTLGDMLGCIVDGRFSGYQLPGLIRHYHQVYLLIEGKFRPDPTNGVLQVPGKGSTWKVAEFGTRRWMYRDLDCFLATLEIHANVKVRRTFDRRESALTVRNLHHWWTDKTYDEHRSTCMFDQSGEPAIGPLSLMRRIAKELPGIGWTKSQRVEKHFDSIVEMVLASPEDWRGVEGVGNGISVRIVEEFRKRKRKWAD